MIKLIGFPSNKEIFMRLVEFFKEVLQICRELGIEPIVDGSLAVFAYTKSSELEVHDIDLSVSEGEFGKIIEVLDGRRIGYRLREWHVLQVIRDDLRIELGSIEHWYKDLLVKTDNLLVDNQAVKILNLESLRELYKRGSEYTASNLEEGNNRQKNESYKTKLALLDSVDS